MAKYRIRFSKTGRAKYVSHLDLLKVFTRCARRIGLDLEYSQGFNPHAELVFSAPLPLGMTSDAEYVDVSLNSETDPHELLELLKKSLPEGIEPLKIRMLEPGEGSVMRPVRFAKYKITAGYGSFSLHEDHPEIFPEIFRSAIGLCLNGNEPVLTLKKSKSGTKLADIRPMIESFGEDLECSGDGTCSFSAVLACGNEVNLRPETAFKGIIDKINGFEPGGNAGDVTGDAQTRRLPLEFLAAHKIEFYDAEKKVLWG